MTRRMWNGSTGQYRKNAWTMFPGELPHSKMLCPHIWSTTTEIGFTWESIIKPLWKCCKGLDYETDEVKDRSYQDSWCSLSNSLRPNRPEHLRNQLATRYTRRQPWGRRSQFPLRHMADSQC